MEMTIEHVTSPVPVTVLALSGDLDASNFEQVVVKAQEIYEAGTRNLLLDLGQLRFMSSSGLVALHSIVLLLRGEAPHDPEAGWEAFHAMDRDRESGRQSPVKLLNPQPKVELTLQKTGMDEFFEIHTDRESALASF